MILGGEKIYRNVKFVKGFLFLFWLRNQMTQCDSIEFAGKALLRVIIKDLQIVSGK